MEGPCFSEEQGRSSSQIEKYGIKVRLGFFRWISVVFWLKNEHIFPFIYQGFMQAREAKSAIARIPCGGPSLRIAYSENIPLFVQIIMLTRSI